jgi:hypothetical protein
MSVADQAQKVYYTNPSGFPSEDKNICAPHTYFFAASYENARITREAAETIQKECENDLYLIKMPKDADNEPIVSIMPALQLPCERELDKELWLNIAKDLAGVRVLFSGIDWEDPVGSYWLRQIVMEQMGIGVSRRTVCR